MAKHHDDATKKSKANGKTKPEPHNNDTNFKNDTYFLTGFDWGPQAEV